VACVLALALATPAAAQVGVKASGCTVSAVDVTLTTTTEAVIVSSPVIQIPADAGEVIVFGWAQLTTGTNTTAVTPKIRRGTLITSTLVNEANAEGVKITAGGTEPFYAMAVETLTVSNAVYSFTLTQTSASANGSALQGGICVLVR
jgi:hypothetical protein